MSIMNQLDTKIAFEVLHKNIKNGEKSEVQKFIDENPYESIAFFDGISAISLSLISSQLKIYELLIINRFQLAATEDLEEILKKTPKNRRREIREIHNRNAKDPNLQHMQILLRNSWLINKRPEQDDRQLYALFSDAFEELNKKNETILKFIAAMKEFKIFFDFSRNCEDLKDPNFRDQNNSITVNVKGLLSDKAADDFQAEKTLRLTLGSVARDFYRFAIEFRYKNGGKPFNKSNENKEIFHKIITNYESVKASDEIFSKINFSNFKDMETKLILCVPESLVFYSKNPSKISEIQEQFKALFEFYEEKVQKDLESDLPRMEKEKEIEKLNKLLGVEKRLKNQIVSAIQERFNHSLSEDRIEIFSSNCVQLTMKSIYDRLKVQNQESSAIFTKLDNLKSEKMFEKVTKVFKNHLEVKIVVDCAQEKVEDVLKVLSALNSEEIKRNILLVVEESLATKTFLMGSLVIQVTPVKHLWSDLTKEAKKELLKSEVTFQGIAVKLEELFSDSTDLEHAPIDDLQKRNEVKIGDDIKFTTDFYVERDFLTMHAVVVGIDKYSPKALNQEEVLDLTENEKSFLLVDKPGNGKSTELKAVARKLKKLHENRWIAFLDLKLYTKFYKKNDQPMTEFKNLRDIANFFSSKLLQLNQFEAEIFNELFQKGKVVILLDGFDEISPTYDLFIMSLTIAIKRKTNNQLWISSRLHLLRKLEDNLHIKAMKFKEFNKEKLKTFFEKFFGSRADSDAETDEVQVKLTNCYDFVKSWGHTFWNPLLLRMIAEISSADSKLNSRSVNLFAIYEKFVTQMYLNLCSKGPDAVGDSASFMRNIRIEEIYQEKAIQIEYEQAGIDPSKLLNQVFPDYSNPSNEQMIRTGLTFIDQTGKFHFIHETFKDFFIMQCFYKKLFLLKFEPENLKPLVDAFCVCYRDKFGQLKKFLNDILGILVIDREDKRFQDFVRLLKENSKIFLDTLYRGGFLNSLQFFAEYVFDDATVFECWLDSNVLMQATKYGVSYVKEVFKIAVKKFDRQQIQQLFRRFEWENEFSFEDQLQSNFDYNNNYVEVFEFLMEKASEFYDQSSLDYFVSANAPLWFKILRRQMNETRLVFKSKFTPIQYRKFLTFRQKYSGNLLHFVCQYGKADNLQVFLDDLIEYLGLEATKAMSVSSQLEGIPPLMQAATNPHENVFAVFWDFLRSNFSPEEQEKFLTQEDKNSQAIVFHYATRNESIEVFDLVSETYINVLGRNKLKEILMTTKVLYQVHIQSTHKLSNLVALWFLVKNLLSEAEIMQMLSAKHSMKNMSEEFEEIIKPFIVKTCTKNNSRIVLCIWLEIAKYFSVNFIKNLISIVDENPKFASSFYRSFKNLRNKEFENILDCAKKNISEEVLEIWEAKLKKMNVTLTGYCVNPQYELAQYFNNKF